MSLLPLRRGLRNNFKAMSPPTPADDITGGWQVGSRWIQVSSGEGWECRDNSAGAAVWIEFGAGGRPSRRDKGWAARTTVLDGDLASDDTVSEIPLGAVTVQINGHGAIVGDEAKNEGCYFSGDGGVTPRARDGVRAGDRLYWNGSMAGYQLETDDKIDLFYDVQ